MEKLLKRIKEYTISDFIFKSSEVIFKHLGNKKKFTKKYIFDNRSIGEKNLLLVLAGFQPFYWDILLSRVKKCIDIFDEKIDVCVCVPGVDKDCVLRNKCRDFGWSYLKIKHDLLAQVQNVAIKIHPNAEYIFKIDEDIVLPSFFFKEMKRAYLQANNELYTDVGFVTPCINVNAACFPYFLDGLNIREEYLNKFGKYTLSPYWHDAPIHESVDLAKWIWEHSLPFDLTSERLLASNRNQLAFSPHRFSIGAILIKRSIWERMEGFVVGCNATMGLEEYSLCNFCSQEMLGIVIAKDILVGHLGFSIQKGPIKELFLNNLGSFKMGDK